MWNEFKKWWNRKWSNWEHSHFVNTYDINYREKPKFRHEILVSHSNDGLVRYKRVRVW